jgi:hypothetical protein
MRPESPHAKELLFEIAAVCIPLIVLAFAWDGEHRASGVLSSPEPSTAAMTLYALTLTNLSKRQGRPLASPRTRSVLDLSICFALVITGVLVTQVISSHDAYWVFIQNANLVLSCFVFFYLSEAAANG